MRRALVAVLLALCGGCESSPPPRPDVVVVTLDTTRADHLGAYGYGRGTTPELDRFAREAVVYRRAWSTASSTLPAHASLLTGLQPTSHGAHFAARGDTALADVLGSDEAPDVAIAARAMRVNRLRPEAVTLAELLQAAGYQTVAFAGGPWLSPIFGLLQGYQTVGRGTGRLAGLPADQVTDAAVAWLARAPRDRPIHLLVNYFDPHAPHEPPPGFDDLPHAKTPILLRAADVVRGKPLEAAQREAYVDRYDGEIRFMDQQLGRLIEVLRAAGRYDGALIIVVADHGESFGEHGLVEHGQWLYEEVLRIPLLVKLPAGRDGGTQVKAPVSIADVLPLVARELDLALPREVEGLPVGKRDLVLAEEYRDALSIAAYGPAFDRDLFVAIRWPWKLVRPAPGHLELYRLDQDPAELENRAGAPEQAALGQALAAARAKLVPPPDHAPPPEVERATRQELRELGYVE